MRTPWAPRCPIGTFPNAPNWGDIFRISFEGVFFPLDDVLDALRPLLCAESSGKIDLIDMEAWTLTRAAFSGTEITVKTVGLNHVLAYSGH